MRSIDHDERREGFEKRCRWEWLGDEGSVAVPFWKNAGWISS